jgi:hypothetical protein
MRPLLLLLLTAGLPALLLLPTDLAAAGCVITLLCRPVVSTPHSSNSPNALGACIAAAKQAMPTSKSQWQISQRFSSHTQLCCWANAAAAAAVLLVW